MLLAVRLRATFENMLAIFERGLRITQLKFFWRHDQVAICRCDTRISYDFKRRDIHLDLFRRLPRKLLTRRNHDRDRHPLKMNFRVGKQRLVGNNSADLVFANEVFRRDYFNDAFAYFRLVRANSGQPSVSYRRIEYTRKQSPIDERNIIEINTFAPDV